MTAVIYNTDTGNIIAEYKSMAAAKAAYTRAAKAKMLGEVIILKGKYVSLGEKVPPMAVMTREAWDREIDYEYVGSKGHKVRLSTPRSCDPNSDLFWSM